MTRMEVDRVEMRDYNASTAGASAFVAGNTAIRRLQFLLDTHVVEGRVTSDDPTVRLVQDFITEYRAETLPGAEAKIVSFANRKFDMDFPE